MPETGLPPGLPAPAERALELENIRTLGDVAQRSEAELRGLQGIGPRAVGILREALAARGLTFRAKTGGHY